MNEPSGGVMVAGGFDDLRCEHVRFLAEAAKLGPVHVVLRSDANVRRLEGRRPKFPESERRYFLEGIRYVDRVSLCDHPAERDAICLAHEKPDVPRKTCTWAVDEANDSDAKRMFCRDAGLQYRVLRSEELDGFPDNESGPIDVGTRKRVLVTGCFDWLHSGHIRFFEEVSVMGDVYAVVGHDANIKLLKGEGHPLFSEHQRRFLVQSVRFVKRAVISTGHGWLDAEPEIQKIRPHIYAVNEDGDRPEKIAYCESHGIEYRVLKRLPKHGLPRRESTALRGF